MNTFIFTKFAKKTFNNLPETTQQRIINKLKSLKSHNDIFSILRKLHKFGPATHRLRIGDYRIILELKDINKNNITFFILDLGIRGKIYK